MTDEKQTAAPMLAPAEMPPEPRVLFYLLSFFIPIAGIILGALYLSKPDRANKEFGKYCLIAALSCIGLCVLLYVCYILFIFGYVAFIFAIIGLAAGAGAMKSTFVWPWLMPK